MKKITAIFLAIGMLMQTAYAYNFPEPDWGALLRERRSMVTAKDFELYVEGSIDNAPYYGAKFEPRAGVYLGTVPEGYDALPHLSSYLTYIDYAPQYYSSYNFAEEVEIQNYDVLTLIGYNTETMDVNYESIRSALNSISASGKPTLVRFANEMNCSNLGDEPDKYIEVFRNVANMIHEYDNLAVVWSPNDMGALDRPFEYFYPGDEYVDWVGVSCYLTKYFVHNPNTAEKDSVYFMTGPYAWTTNKLKPFMEFLEKNNIQKPVMISEGGVERYNSRGEDMTGWHEPRLRNMLWNTIMKYPRIKMINYFNVDHWRDQEKYRISEYPDSVNIYNEAAQSGAYKKTSSADPDFVFSRANEGGTLIAEDGIVNLYTLAYLPNNPDIYVNYRIDGGWVHSSNEIPYKFSFNINNVTDGAHTLTINSAGEEKSYTFYKRGQYMRFGGEPDTSIAPPKAAEKEITVYVNDEKIEFDQPPVIIDGRTLVPMRAIFEALGADVEWEQSTKTATAMRDNESVKITIDDNHMTKINNGMKFGIELDVPAKLISDRTMVPARAIAEAFGAEVEWDGENRAVIIAE